jgi:hypothetical protein
MIDAAAAARKLIFARPAKESLVAIPDGAASVSLSVDAFLIFDAFGDFELLGAFVLFGPFELLGVFVLFGATELLLGYFVEAKSKSLDATLEIFILGTWSA